MADAPERKHQTTLLNTLAQRVMGRWQQTPLTTVVQRAMHPALRTVSTPVTRAAAIEGFVQRVTEQKAQSVVWKPRATSKQEAIEGFTDNLVQRFPDLSAKYLVRSEDTVAPQSQTSLVYSGETPESSEPETIPPFSESSPASSSSTFDVDALPSVPADVVARHRAEAQQRAASVATPPSKSPRTMQRQKAGEESRLVRPRSKVDYIGSRTTGPTASPPPAAPSAPPPSSPALAAEPSDAPIQAKAETLEIQESTPLEEPKWRSRPRAGFQSLPTKATAEESSAAVPFKPIQTENPVQRVSSEATDSDTSAITNPLPDQSSKDSLPIQRREDGGDDEPLPPSGGVSPDEPPPLPPSSTLSVPDMPVQRTTSSADDRSSEAQMPLRMSPPVPSSLPEPETDSENTAKLPSLSLGVPAKAIRRTSQAIPILRKPNLPSTARPRSEGAVPAALPSDRTTSTAVTAEQSPPSPIAQKGTTTTPLQPKSESTTFFDESSVVQRQSDIENTGIDISSLHEIPNISAPLDPLESDKSISEPALQAETSVPESLPPIQRLADSPPEADSVERVTAMPHAAESPSPDREAMPLRTTGASAEPPIQTQPADTTTSVPESLGTESSEENPPLQRTSVSSAPNIPTQASSGSTDISPSTLSGAATAPIKQSQPQEPITQPIQRSEDTPQQPQPILSEPIQRSATTAPPLSATNTEIAQTEHTPLRATPTPPSTQTLQREAMPLRTEPSGSDPLQRETHEDHSMAGPIKTERSTPSSEAQPAHIVDQNVLPSAEPPLQRVEERQSSQNVSTGVDTPVRSGSMESSLPSSPEDSRSGHTPGHPVLTTEDSLPATSALEASSYQSDEPIQRVAVESTSTVVPERADMPLRVETDNTPGLPTEMSQVSDTSDRVSPTNSSGVEENPTPPLFTPSPTVLQSAVAPLQKKVADSSKDISDDPVKESPSIADSEPVQRVTATSPSTSVVPAQAEMPLRHDNAQPAETFQRQTDEAAITDAPVSSVIAYKEHDQATPTSLTTSVPAQPETTFAPPPATDAGTVQRKVEIQSDNKPVERVEAELSRPSSPVPAQADMPLRETHDISVPPLQRHIAPATEAEIEKSASTVPAPAQHESRNTGDTLPSPNVRSDAPDITTTEPILQQETAKPESSPSQSVHHDDRFTATDNSPVQRVSATVSPTNPAFPSEEDLPLRVERPQPISADPIQRTDENQSVGEGKPVVEERQARIPVENAPAETSLAVENEGPPPVTDSTFPVQSESAVEQTKLAPEVEAPLQRVVAEPSSPAPTTPDRNDMTLRVADISDVSPNEPALSGNAKTDNTTIESTSPIQRATGETIPIASTLPDEAPITDAHASDTARKIEEPSSPVVLPTDTSSPLPIQRVGLETTQPSPPHREEMPLRTASPPLQLKQEDPITGNDSVPVIPTEQTVAAEISTESGTRQPQLDLAAPLVPPEQPSTPVTETPPPDDKRFIQPLSPTTEPPVQRKVRVKGARIQRRTPETPPQVAMPVATPVQRRNAPVESVDIPSPTVTAAGTDHHLLTVDDHEGSASYPPLVSDITAEATSRTVSIVQRMEALPLVNPAAIAVNRNSVRQRNRLAPINSPLQRQAPSGTTSQTPEMLLLQRAKTGTTTNTENDEAYMDIRALFDDEAESSGTNDSLSKTVDSLAKKEPTESDAMRALETLAREIYPLLKQMIARERERHRGF